MNNLLIGKQDLANNPTRRLPVCVCLDVSQSMETFNILVYKNLDNEYNFIRDKKANIKNRQKFKLYNVFKVNDNGIKMKNDLYKKLRGIKLKLSKYKF